MKRWSVSPVYVMVLAFTFVRSAGAAPQETVAARPDSVAREVRHVLVTLPFYTVFDNLDFRDDGGTVTLLGQVTRPLLKSDAEKAVKEVAGVHRVVNQIEVLPLSAADGKLRLAEYLAVYGGALPEYQQRAVPPIHIVVRNGTVTLEGSVATEMEKTQAFTQASTVPGVSSLVNHLRVAP